MKKALIVGINYLDSDDRVKLQGCIEDAQSIKQMLIADLGYTDNDIILLTDDQADASKKPTTSNIMNTIRNCVAESENYSEFWFHYSGHGSQFTDSNGDEADQKDEVIIPCNYLSEGAIGDDTLRYFFNQIKCKTFVVMDCCNSGTNLDLPHQYKYVDGWNLTYANNSKFESDNKQIYKISGSRDDQVSLSMYDIETGGYRGACSHALSDILKENNYNLTFGSLVEKMNRWMSQNMSDQRPTLASTDINCTEVNFSAIIRNEYTPVLSAEELLQKEVASLKENIEYYKNLITNLNSNVAVIQQEKLQLQNANNNLEQEKQQLLDANNTLQQNNASIEQEKQQLQNANNSLEQEKQQLLDANIILQQNKSSLEQEKQQLQNANNSLEQEKQQLEQTVQQLEAEKTNYIQLHSTDTTLVKANDTLQQQNKQLYASNLLLEENRVKLLNERNALDDKLKKANEHARNINNELRGQKQRNRIFIKILRDMFIQKGKESGNNEQ